MAYGQEVLREKGVKFKTLRELKQKLPQALNEIRVLKEFALVEQHWLDLQLHSRCLWLTNDRDMFWWETDKEIYETYENLILYETRAKWLQAQVDKIKDHPDL